MLARIRGALAIVVLAGAVILAGAGAWVGHRCTGFEWGIGAPAPSTGR